MNNDHTEKSGPAVDSTDDSDTEVVLDIHLPNNSKINHVSLLRSRINECTLPLVRQRENNGHDIKAKSSIIAQLWQQHTATHLAIIQHNSSAVAAAHCYSSCHHPA